MPRPAPHTAQLPYHEQLLVSLHRSEQDSAEEIPRQGPVYLAPVHIRGGFEHWVLHASQHTSAKPHYSLPRDKIVEQLCTELLPTFMKVQFGYAPTEIQFEHVQTFTRHDEVTCGLYVITRAWQFVKGASDSLSLSIDLRV